MGTPPPITYPPGRLPHSLSQLLPPGAWCRLESLLLLSEGPSCGRHSVDLGYAMLFQEMTRGQRPPGWDRIR